MWERPAHSFFESAENLRIIMYRDHGKQPQIPRVHNLEECKNELQVKPYLPSVFVLLKSSCYVQHQSTDVIIMQGRKRTILLTSQNEWQFLSMIELMGNISFFFFSTDVVSLILFILCIGWCILNTKSKRNAL